jgi:hypothetical protein
MSPEGSSPSTAPPAAATSGDDRPRLAITFGAVTEKNIEQLKVGSGCFAKVGSMAHVSDAVDCYCFCLSTPCAALQKLLAAWLGAADCSTICLPLIMMLQVLNRAIFPINYPERMYKDVLVRPCCQQ